MKRSTSLHLFLFAVLFMVFFHLLTALVEATYTFGLLGTDIPAEIVYVLFLLTPVLLLVYPRILDGKTGRGFALVTGMISLLCWGALLFLDTRGRMIASGIGTGSMLLFFPAIIHQKPANLPAVSLGASLAFGILAGVLLRQEIFRTIALPGGFGLAIPAGIILTGVIALFNWFRQRPQQSRFAPLARISFLNTTSACLGISSIFILLYFAFSNPAVISRWTGASTLGVIGLTSAISAVFLFFFFAPGRGHLSLSQPLLLAWNALFILALAGTILPYQISFPIDPSAYPLAEADTDLTAGAALILTLLLHPILYADAALLFGSLANERISARALAWGMAFAALYQLMLIFAHVFTTVYDYIPVIGPFFRDRFWLVHIIPCIVLFSAILWQKGTLSFEPEPAYQRWPLLFAAGLAILVIGIVVTNFFLPIAEPGADTLRVMTYNIQQGYSAEGQKNFDGQLEVIRDRQPDILGLQESDMARISGGNSDIVHYLATNLRMNSYYGPKTVTGTFGIALLSRYPIQNPRTYYLYSKGEQTAVIEAEIRKGLITYTIMVTHLGNGGPLVQQQEILALTAGEKNIILMGDFNFQPSTEQYQQTAALLQDGWLQARHKETTPPGQDLETRIDHIFLSPGLSAMSAEFIGEGPSDHPALFLELDLLP